MSTRYCLDKGTLHAAAYVHKFNDYKLLIEERRMNAGLMITLVLILFAIGMAWFVVMRRRQGKSVKLAKNIGFIVSIVAFMALVIYFYTSVLNR
ncbi:hypothetical protein ACFQY6_10660 [Legionella taurinensis]|nr:hypothetical protein [Legionella taurinensis]